LLPVLTGLVVLLIAGVAVSAVPLPDRAARRLTALLALYILVGVLLASVGAIQLTLAGADPSPAWFEAVTFPVIAMAVAFVASLTTR
ncbi:hypothetical protein SB767_32775, partial [Bacillus sp. SIMBA_069]